MDSPLSEIIDRVNQFFSDSGVVLSIEYLSDLSKDRWIQFCIDPNVIICFITTIVGGSIFLKIQLSSNIFNLSGYILNISLTDRSESINHIFYPEQGMFDIDLFVDPEFFSYRFGLNISNDPLG